LYGPRFSAACDSHYFADGVADYVALNLPLHLAGPY
jgi:hypothetical protein